MHYYKDNTTEVLCSNDDGAEARAYGLAAA